MQPLVRVGPWLVAAALVALVVVSWARSSPDLTQEDAAAVAVGALGSQDVDATVATPPSTGAFRSDSGQEMPVWDIELAVGEETISVKVPLTVGELVFIDDNIGPAAAPGRLLSDAQIEDLDGYRHNPALDRRQRENLVLSIGALLALSVSIGIALVARRLRADDVSAAPVDAPIEATAPPETTA